MRTNTSDLQDEDTVVVEKVVDLPEETLIPPNSNVLRELWSINPTRKGAYTHLGHLETNDLGERTLLRGNFAVVHAQDAGTTWITTIDFDPLVTKLRLILAEGNARDFAAVVLVGESSKGTPSTSDVEQAVVRLEVKFLTDHGQLIVLELFEGFLFFDVRNDAGSIDHAGAKEPFVEVIAS